MTAQILLLSVRKEVNYKMATLKNLFSIYQELPNIEKEPIDFSRMNFVNNYIYSKTKKSEETQQLQQQTTQQQSEVTFPEWAVYPKQETKYSRMEAFLSNKTPLQTTMSFFINKGLTPYQAAGFAGNFLSESELNPKATNNYEKKKGYKGYGRGIAQWSNERIQQFEKYIGKPIEESSLEDQLNFVWHEVEQRPELLKQIKQAKDINQATDIVYRGYENGSANALATPEQLTKIYGKAWSKLGYKPYNFKEELSKRQKKSLQAFDNYE